MWQMLLTFRQSVMRLFFFAFKEQTNPQVKGEKSRLAKLTAPLQPFA